MGCRVFMKDFVDLSQIDRVNSTKQLFGNVLFGTMCSMSAYMASQLSARFDGSPISKLDSLAPFHINMVMQTKKTTQNIHAMMTKSEAFLDGCHGSNAL